MLIPIVLIDIDRNIALEGSKIYSSLIKRGEEIELNDCLIAASALIYGINEIVTRNIKHFQKIEGIRAVTPEELGF